MPLLSQRIRLACLACATVLCIVGAVAVTGDLTSDVTGPPVQVAAAEEAAPPSTVPALAIAEAIRYVTDVRDAHVREYVDGVQKAAVIRLAAAFHADQQRQAEAVRIRQVTLVRFYTHPSTASTPSSYMPTHYTYPQPVAPVASSGSVNGYPCGGSLPSCCTLEHESHGTPTAMNPSGAAGLWQFMPGTWGGYGGYASAASAPAAVQNARAAQVFAGGAGWGNWKGDGCYPGG